MNILRIILSGFEIFSGIYSIAYLLLYVVLAAFSYKAIKKYLDTKHYLNKSILIHSNPTLGVSIIAPAFNESATIIYNVKSLLSQNYLKFEVIIVNDGSTDETLEHLINEFQLVQVSFFYQEKIKTKPVKGHYKSVNPIYSKLLVVDKENGKSKADASNAGINSASYDLFLCTDVDCVLRKDTIAVLTKPFIENTKRVIATGAVIRASNSCVFKDGVLYRSHLPTNFYARFQELEYIRSFLFGRMSLSQTNGLLLISGALGLFDKQLVIDAGGYFHQSLGEDMELIIRMRKEMNKRNEDFIIRYIPETLCWTEVPFTKAVFLRQRIRWARGLIQTLYLHRSMFFNTHYGKTGWLFLPYFLLFEFAVPILEIMGIVVLILELAFFSVNYNFLFVISLFVYLLFTCVTTLAVYLDQLISKHYANAKELAVLLLMIFLEPFVYHPINIYASLTGYFHFLISKEKKWGIMTRKGFINTTNSHETTP